MEPPTFLAALGRLALTSRLRALTERLTADAARVLELYDVPLKPAWWPVYYVLSQNGSSTAAEVAQAIGQSHVAVGKTAGAMRAAGLVARAPDPDDGRRTRLSLTAAGRAIAPRIAPQYVDVDAAVAEMLAEGEHDFWAALGELEGALARRPLPERVRAHRRANAAAAVRLVDYDRRYATAFHDLNVAWIEQYFTLEPEDRRLLEDPQAHLVDAGGYIAMALVDGEPLGTCALLPLPDDPDYEFELVKMAVSPRAQGMGIGAALGRHVLAKAGELGAKRVYLETNPILETAVRLYRRLGFAEVVGHDSPFARCGLQMGIAL